MVVKRKPVNVEEFIQEGGSEAQLAASPITVPEIADDEVKGLKLRLSVQLLAEIDAAVKRRRPAPSRHQWILEAIYEKLSRGTPEG
ncbi:hypothetical protein [Pseudanabaena sp. PCC 6802]|uniref:hypothetical protein n=1 Tax=Pseudanabaena sp. PCC 6802 TaxID=118173 RepID=UPI000344CCB9|nr:hypothetical protein [Pseudanabaena sp. PCC 6802]